jgi:L-asparagine transporter-like permease
VGTVIDKELVGPEPKNKEKQKKKRKRDRFWRQMGSNLLIGIVFLSVAVLMALIQVPSLTLLFGLASILFLIFGLKKVFRKRKRKSRNPFNKEK